MKIQFQNHDAVAHAWASLSQSEGRASNLFFNGPVIYSYGYHFPIAKLLEKENICLFTNRGSSNSTEKQKSKVRRAIPHGYTVIYCRTPDGATSENLSAWQGHIVGLRARFADSKHKITRGNLAVEISRQQFEAGAYCTALNTPLPSWILETKEESEAASYVRAAAEKRETNREARERALNAARAVKSIERLEQWRAGEQAPRDGFHYHPVALRVRGDQIETSHGADIPVIDAWKVWPMLNRLKKSGKSTPAGFEMRLGVHRFESFDGEILTVGCHKIPYSEIEKIARVLGLLEEQTA